MAAAIPRPETWLRVTKQGLYCRPGKFYVDPPRPVARAVVTHGHADHARPGEDGVAELVPVGKAYVGFTDEELRRLDN
jgi:glyoxylase-like metal-dependent hydrolase (beta-lactamase superfamily II)